MDEKEITCIVCPIGCKIRVRSHGNQCEIVEGSKCKRGVEYAQLEALDPRRMLTSSVLVLQGEWPLVSVKTTKPVPKKKISPVLKTIQNTEVEAPVTIGDVLLENIEDLGIDVVATKTVRRSQEE
jgi:CxxC motif-containing protein